MFFKRTFVVTNHAFFQFSFFINLHNHLRLKRITCPLVSMYIKKYFCRIAIKWQVNKCSYMEAQLRIILNFNTLPTILPLPLLSTSSTLLSINAKAQTHYMIPLIQESNRDTKKKRKKEQMNSPHRPWSRCHRASAATSRHLPGSLPLAGTGFHHLWCRGSSARRRGLSHSEIAVVGWKERSFRVNFCIMSLNVCSFLFWLSNFNLYQFDYSVLIWLHL